VYRNTYTGEKTDRRKSRRDDDRAEDETKTINRGKKKNPPETVVYGRLRWWRPLAARLSL